jgi:hypothetical protein
VYQDRFEDEWEKNEKKWRTEEEKKKMAAGRMFGEDTTN